MSWEIRIPHRSRDDSLVDVVAACRHLPGQDEDRDVMRQLVIQAQIDGKATSAGGLIDHVSSLAPAARRKMIDEARAELGLASTEMADARTRIQATATRPDPFPMCAVTECTTIPIRMGVPFSPDVRRWWCPAHVHLAAPGDMEPRGWGLRYAPSGALIPDDPIDDERERERVESEQRQQDARRADAQADYAERRKYESAHRETLDRELPAHLRGAT